MLFGNGAAGLLGSPYNRRKGAPEILGAISNEMPPAAVPVPGRSGGLLGSGTNKPNLPGVIGGFAGGTWNADGSPATPDRDGAMRPLPGSSGGTTVFDARESAPNHWSVEGFDKMRSEMPPLANLPREQAGPLGGSMRQPFDYDAAMAQLAGPQKKIKDWQWILAGIGDVAATMGGGQGRAIENLVGYRDGMRERQRAAQEQILKWQHGDYAAMRDADLRASAPFSSGRDRVQWNPATGQAQVIYDGPEDFETYAGTLGLEPGSDEYFQAVEDYVLKGNGPSAHSRDLELDDHRTSNDRGLEAYRQGNRVSMERMRQGNRQGMVDYRNANPAPARPRMSSGSPRPQVVTVKTPSEASKLKPGQLYKGPDGVVRER